MNQLGVAAATSVVFECCRAGDTSYSTGVPVHQDAIELKKSSPEFYTAMNSDVYHTTIVLRSLSKLEALLKGGHMNSTSTDLWPLSDAYMSCCPGPQIEEIMSIFTESPAALAVLFREIAEELVNLVARTSHENLLRALGWLLPHTSNVIQVLCNCGGVSVSIADCLETLASWLRLHNSIQDGPPQDLTWGRRTAELDKRNTRLLSSDHHNSPPSLLQCQLHNYSLIQNLHETIKQPDSLKASCNVIMEASQLWGHYTHRNKDTLVYLIRALASVSDEITYSLLRINPFAGNCTKSVIHWTLRGSERASELFGNLEVQLPANIGDTDSGMFPKWTLDDLESGAEEDQDLVLIWIAAVSDTIQSEWSIDFCRGDCFRLHVFYLKVVEAVRKLMFHINFTVRLRSLEVITLLIRRYHSINSDLYDNTDCLIDMRALSHCNTVGDPDQVSDVDLIEAKALCGEFSECFIVAEGRYIGIDPCEFFSVVARSLLFGCVQPRAVGGSEDFSDSEKFLDFLDMCWSAWGSNFMFLINGTEWIAITEMMLQCTDDCNWGLRSVLLLIHGRMVDQYILSRREAPHGIEAVHKCLMAEPSPIDPNQVVSNCILRSQTTRAIAYCVSYMILFVEADVAKDYFRQALRLMFSDVIEMARVSEVMAATVGNNFTVGEVTFFPSLICSMCLKILVDSLRSFISEGSRLLHHVDVMTLPFIEELISSHGDVILNDSVTVSLRTWICCGLGDMISNQDIPNIMICHENIVRVILQELKAKVNVIYQEYGYTPNMQDPSLLLPPAFVAKMNSVLKSSSVHERATMDHDGRICTDFYALLNIFWNSMRCLVVSEQSFCKKQNLKSSEPPDGMSLWPMTSDNEVYGHPNMIILEKFFDEVADLSLITFSSNYAIIDNCCETVVTCIEAARHSSLRYSVVTRFVDKVAESHVRHPSIFHFNAIRTMLSFADIKPDNAAPTMLSTVQSLGRAVEMSVGDVINKMKSDDNYALTNPQMVGMAMDTFGLAMIKPGLLAYGVISNLSGPNGLTTVLDTCVEKLESIQDVKIIMTMILALTRIAYWWTPSKRIIGSAPSRSQGLSEVIHETTEAARKFATSFTTPFPRRMMKCCIRLTFSNFETNDQWLGLAADCITEVCQKSNPFHAEGIAGLEEGFNSLCGEYQVDEERRTEYLRRLVEGCGNRLTVILKECVSEHRSTIRMRQFT
eukprot:GHVH01010637.1.p1 GENE.GHVH01010637.1~~GHVH01010637.1.p1  ORF type:complete len:1352 (+),score=180.57 GHVH01010637.1:450-4058(+)